MGEREAKVRQYLKENFGHYRDEIEATDPLDGIVDSLGLLDLVEYVEREFGATIPTDAFSPMLFNSIDKILKTIEDFQTR
jgi:acyl carrier protein